MILEAIILSVVTGSALGQEEFFKKYAYTKVMIDCFGADVYYDRLARVAQAQRICNNYPVYTIQKNVPQHSFGQQPQGYYPGQGQYNPGAIPNYSPQPGVVPNYNYFPQSGVTFPGRATIVQGRKKRQVQQRRDLIFDGDAIRGAISEVTAAISNFTCVLTKLNLVDQNLRMNTDTLLNNYFSATNDDALRRDLIEATNFCEGLTKCLPVEHMGSPIPEEVLRLMAFMKCERKWRLASCFKSDLRRNIHHFDTSALPNDGGKTTAVEKLMTIFMGVESADDLELF